MREGYQSAVSLQLLRLPGYILGQLDTDGACAHQDLLLHAQGYHSEAFGPYVVNAEHLSGSVARMDETGSRSDILDPGQIMGLQRLGQLGHLLQHRYVALEQRRHR